MQTAKPNAETEKLRLAQLFDFFQQHQASKYQEQVLDFYDKLKNQMLHICFSGHFSAGKSTLINRLMDEPLLPQSPIPTSANIVEIRRGPDEIMVHFAERSPVKMESLPPIDRLHQLCRAGDEVKKIEIFKKFTPLPEGISFMDTPGIDATNDADRLMTESALHKVDVLFYIMDYNHVQSEVNATFLKKLDAMKKPYYVIINQMDKHDEEEISFDDFQTSLEQVFQQWKINPEGIFYTSMKDEAVINQFNSLQQVIDQLITKNHQRLLTETIQAGMEHTIHEFLQDRQKELDVQLEGWQEELDTLPEMAEDSETLQQTYQKTVEEKEQIIASFSDEVERTTKNAQLVPFDIREKAEQVLVAYDQKFKTGLFRNQKKIQAEREQRLTAFYEALREKVEIGLEWKLRDKLTEMIQPYMPVDFSESIFTSHFQPTDFVQLMDEGATLNGEYLLVYTDRVAQAIKRTYRQYYKQKWQELESDILQLTNQMLEKTMTEIEHQRHYQSLLDQMDRCKEGYAALRVEAFAILSPDYACDTSLLALIEQQLASNKVTKLVNLNEMSTASTMVEEHNDATPKTKEAVTSHRFDQTVSDVQTALRLFAPIQDLQGLSNDLTHKQTRLQERSFTIALFGAFSAGKSSFANALIGEKVLPVSPNPTTAAINKISPIRGDYRHKDVYVVLKQEQELIENINEMTAQTFEHIQEAYRWVKKTNLDKLTIADQHKSFLTAFLHGYPEMKERIGTAYRIGFTSFQRYIRDEEIACFVKEMELFYQSPLTDKQITLVDTPGADSVNARHTELAFSYIKDADAILFVTYYNHPFSKPDQQFLERLGTVKDAFALDKMFFIINAIDLAKDQTEAQLVIDYIRKELQVFDITQPRMHAVSSKQALQAKTEDTGLLAFERNFYRFIKEELTQMSMQAIYTDLSKGLGLVTQWLSIVNSNEQEKVAILAENDRKEQQIKQIIAKVEGQVYLETVLQKLHKQIYYATQRLTIQYQDVFKDFVHPGAIKSQGRKGKKELEQALNQLIKALNRRLQHEFEAISIRLEQSMNQALQQMRQDTQAKAQHIDDNFSLSQWEDVHFNKAPVELYDLIIAEQQLSKWVQAYKDTKAFFAEKGRQVLEEESAAYLQTEWQQALEQLEEQLRLYYQQQWQAHYHPFIQQFTDEIVSYYQHLRDGIQHSGENKQQLETIHQQLTNMLARP
ncbi:dynamin family protein [Gracilibacillus phocaeensis]|uniref:dynamin family protein n=1 Tax=Gracilibacillus phocaeensis TaxID=2042304 RepID=UPI0013EF4045|nr:dynamin family protein [Gracilibacillus phocaeensis]